MVSMTLTLIYVHSLYSLCLQCRKFKGSQAVCSRAGVIYDKFKTLFLLPGSKAVDNHEVISFLYFSGLLVFQTSLKS